MVELRTRFDAPSTGSARSPARKASTGTLKGAGNDPLIPVLEWIRSTRIGGFKNCTKVAKIAGSPRVQSSLPSCNLRERPSCIATTRYDRHNHREQKEPARLAFREQIQNHNTLVKNALPVFLWLSPRDRRGSPSLGVVALATAAIASA